MLIDVYEPITTNSWRLEAYTDDKFVYQIDEIPDGLTFTFPC